MDIENLSFLTELTDEDASHVNGGAIGYFNPFEVIPGDPNSDFGNTVDFVYDVYEMYGLV